VGVVWSVPWGGVRLELCIVYGWRRGCRRMCACSAACESTLGGDLMAWVCGGCIVCGCRSMYACSAGLESTLAET